MKPQPFRTTIYGFALLFGCLCIWAGGRAGSDAALAQGLPPRPSATAVPTQPAHKPASSAGDDGSTVSTGRIAGTVIELGTGAPAPGINVIVGEETITTDANGNYDLSGLPAGSYQVALALTLEQGTPAQNAVAIQLDAGATVIQHLGFHASPAPVAAPTALPKAPAAQVPAALPRTAGANDWVWPAIFLVTGLIGVGMWLRRRSLA